jgi:hypothetical protein
MGKVVEQSLVTLPFTMLSFSYFFRVSSQFIIRFPLYSFDPLHDVVLLMQGTVVVGITEDNVDGAYCNTSC